MERDIHQKRVEGIKIKRNMWEFVRAAGGSIGEKQADKILPRLNQELAIAHAELLLHEHAEGFEQQSGMNADS